MIAELVRRPFQFVQKEMVSLSPLQIHNARDSFPPQNAGTAAPSFTRDILTKPELELERSTDPTFEHTIQWAAASMYAGETMPSLLSIQVLSLLIW